MTRLARLGAALLLPLSLSMTACSWFTDFKRQPKVDPWESVADTVAARGNPQLSVPVTGTFVAGFQVSYQALPATVDSMSGLANPTPPSDSSLANGHKYFQINCAVCHGDRGMGDGPATKYGMPGIGIGVGSAAANTRSDGYIFGMIRNGRGLMPSYDRIEEMDRWDVVNYLRGLQGKLGREVAVGPVGYPGQTGAALPGYSRMAPTRPAPFLRPSHLNRGGVGGMTPGPMTTEAGTPNTPGGAPDSLGRTQPGHEGPGSAHQPAPPGAGRTSDTSAARKTGGPQ
jgi:mono/diheme cytochrome c family protein